MRYICLIDNAKNGSVNQLPKLKNRWTIWGYLLIALRQIFSLRCGRPSDMEINETTQSVTFLCRLFGFAPYKIIRERMNQIVDFKLSYAMCCYSIALIIFLIVSPNVTLYFEQFDDTRRLVRVALINMRCAPIVSNIITSMFAVENTRRVNMLLRKVRYRRALCASSFVNNKI